MASGVLVGDIPCYPKRRAVIPQDLPYGSGAACRNVARRASKRKAGKERVAARVVNEGVRRWSREKGRGRSLD